MLPRQGFLPASIRPSRVICNLLEVWPKFPRESPISMSSRAHPTLGEGCGPPWASWQSSGEYQPRSGIQSLRQLWGCFIHKPWWVCVCIMRIWVKTRRCLKATSWALNDEKECLWERLSGCVCPCLLSFVILCVYLVCVRLRTCLCRSECSGREWLCRSEENSDCGRYRWTGCYSEKEEHQNRNVRKKGQRFD